MLNLLSLEPAFFCGFPRLVVVLDLYEMVGQARIQSAVIELGT